MDIQTKDGILIRGIPDGTPDEAIKARIEQIRAGKVSAATPSDDATAARMNPSIAAQGVKVRENMTPPESVTDPRYPAYAKAQEGSAALDAIGGLVGGGVGGILKPGASAVRGLAEGLMRSAIKPSTVEDTAKVKRAIATALETKSGGMSGLNMESITGRGGELNQQVEALLANHAGSLPTASMPGNASNVLSKARYENRVDDVASGNNMLARFMSGDAMQNPDIPLSQAQAIKQGIYRTVGDAGYGAGLKPAGERDALKGLAAGLRRDIETQAPAVAPLNAEAGDLWNLHNIAGRGVAAAQNKNPLGLNLGVALSNPAAATAFALDRSQLLKALLARGLYNSQRVPGAAAGAALGSNMSNGENQ